MKRLLLFLVLTCLSLTAALADSWQGAVTAGDVTWVVSPASGVLESFSLEEGRTVTAGERLGGVRGEKVFAPVSGTVASVQAEAGDQVSGAVIEIAPTSLYTVTCTVSGVASAPEAALIHMGETLWMKCTADGSHLAMGRVVGISGATFEVEATAGELYIGETVYVCRSRACAAADRVGRGTVLAHATVSVSADGVILLLRVSPGDRVEKGQWLMTLSDAADISLSAPADGTVVSVSAVSGSQVQQGQTLAEIAGSRLLEITVSADEALRFVPGEVWGYVRADDPHETLRRCTVSRVFLADGQARVELIPEDSPPIGLSVTVTEPAEE